MVQSARLEKAVRNETAILEGDSERDNDDQVAKRNRGRSCLAGASMKLENGKIFRGSVLSTFLLHKPSEPRKAITTSAVAESVPGGPDAA